jgi:hypothetical protein
MLSVLARPADKGTLQVGGVSLFDTHPKIQITSLVATVEEPSSLPADDQEDDLVTDEVMKKFDMIFVQHRPARSQKVRPGHTPALKPCRELREEAA